MLSDMNNCHLGNISKELVGTMLSMLIFTTTIALAAIDPETAVGVWAFDEGAGKETKDISGLITMASSMGQSGKTVNLVRGLNSTGDNGLKSNRHQNSKSASN